jgi:sugar/nucleoside kinase (ribokinase family)
MKRSKTSHASAFGTGLIALDIVIGVGNETILDSAGGTLGNVLTILSFLGWSTYPIARLNGDPASLRVKADLRRWGVHLDYAERSPTSATPIIIQEIIRDTSGTPKHRFAWRCPHCGKPWPKFAPVTAASVEVFEFRRVKPHVFFMDRLSRAALNLAKRMAVQGALIVFEPSASSDEKLWSEALRVAHILKYSRDRCHSLSDADYRKSSVRLEIETGGSDGLRFCSRLRHAKTRDWVYMPPMRAPIVVDTCGAGDWCTAGILDSVGRRGHAEFTRLTTSQLHSALKYGQTLAAWNCGYAGARGGMYAVNRKQFEAEVAIILSGKAAELGRGGIVRGGLTNTSTFCLACA